MKRYSAKTAVSAALAALMVMGTAAAAEAQSFGGTPARGDDGDIWHVPGNVALLAYQPNAVEAGAAFSPVDSAGATVPVSSLQNGTFDFVLKSSLIAYYLRKQSGLTTNWIGAAVPFGRAVSLGYAYSWGSGLSGTGKSSLGLVVRPIDFASLGLTFDSGGTPAPVAGLGVAVRPLVFDPKIAPLLTLTADAHVQSGAFQMESAGAHISLNNGLGFRGWYDFQRNSLGLEATLSLGPAQQHAAIASVTNPAAWTLGESVGFTPGRATSPAAFGRSILVVNDIDTITHDQPGAGFLTGLFSSARSVGFRDLVEEIRRAADDPQIGGVVIENLPSLGGPASVEEFTDALGLVRKAHKKVYIYASSYPSSFQFQMLASQANWIGLSPEGSVNMTGRSVRRLYLKDFLDRIGVRFVNLAPWKTKSAFNNFSESQMSSVERDMITRYEGDLQSQALAGFAAGRGKRLKSDPKDILAAGPFMTAGRALDDGVIDAAQYREEFENMVKKQNEGASFVTSLPTPLDRSWGPSILDRRVAVVHLSGNIITGRGAAGVSIGTEAVDMLRHLRKEKSVSAILLRVDSPGGVIVTSDEIAHEVKLAVDAGKPVVVSMGDYAASGGYYISSYASRIFAEPGTITGSIGVTGLIPNISGSLVKLGINSQGVELSKSAGTLDPTAPLRNRDLQLARESILSDYARFVSVVADGRKMKPTRVKELGEGKVWTGREALSIGLVDALGGLDAAKTYLKEKLGGRVSFKDYRPGQVSPFGVALGGGLGGGARSALYAALAGPQTAELVKTLGKAAGPYARELSSLLELGTGPLLYFDWTRSAD